MEEKLNEHIQIQWLRYLYQKIVNLMYSNSYLQKKGLEKGNIRSTKRIKFLAAGLDNICRHKHK